MVESVNEQLLKAQAWGFWVRTKLAPHRAVRWEPQFHEDGRRSFRGQNWVEVLPQGTDRIPERFFAADVERAGPHEWLTYYPHPQEPVCGWAREPGVAQYCPRLRGDEQPFCPKHMAELEAPQGEEN